MNKQQQTNKPTGEPKPEEKEERMVNGEKWYYYADCMSGRWWNKMHKSEQHKRGAGQNKNKDNYQGYSSHLTSFDGGYEQDFQSG